VDLIGPRAIRVITDKQDQVLFHHDAVELYMYSLIALDSEIKYAPQSKLIYVHVDLEKYDSDVWLVFSLSEGEISGCRHNGDGWTLPTNEVFRDER
jgi:hypothetical protein